MTEALFVFAYLAAILAIGVGAGRKRRETREDYFLAGRSLGTFVFLLSLFGTNMTAFTILGASGRAYQDGIGVYGLMASSSALVIPLTILFVGTRMWAVGKRFGHLTPVQIFRDRWEAGHIGTAIFALQATLLVPYIIIGVMGGGTALNTLSRGWVPEWLGGAIVALAVMSYVFFGGMRGTAWVNAIQTLLFLSFGLAAFLVIGSAMGGFGAAVERLLGPAAAAPGAGASPAGDAQGTLVHLLTRERMNPYYFFSYTFIPLSAIAFPHMAIFCLTARKMESFKRTVVFYPLCLLAIWLPSVFLGTVAASDPQVRAAIGSPAASDEVIPLLLRLHAPSWLAGVLGAGIMAAVMAADSQILALSTMFTEDVFAYYGGKRAFGERVQVLTGRAFVVGVTVVAYAIAMTTSEGIFNLAVKYAFTGFAALSPLIIAALFWKRSTKWGALASVLVVAAGLIAIAWLEGAYPPEVRPYDLWGGILTRTPGGIAVWKGFLPVLPLVLLSALAMVAGSLATRPPSRGTIERYFPGPRRSEAVPALPAWARG